MRRYRTEMRECVCVREQAGSHLHKSQCHGLLSKDRRGSVPRRMVVTVAIVAPGDERYGNMATRHSRHTVWTG